MRGQGNDPLAMLKQLMGLAGAAQQLEQGPMEAQMKAQLAQSELQRAREESQLHPFKVQQAQFATQEMPRESKDRSMARSLGAGADFAQMAAAMGMPPEELKLILSEKLGLGSYNQDQMAQDAMKKRYPTAISVFDKLQGGVK